MANCPWASCPRTVKLLLLFQTYFMRCKFFKVIKVLLKTQIIVVFYMTQDRQMGLVTSKLATLDLLIRFHFTNVTYMVSSITKKNIKLRSPWPFFIWCYLISYVTKMLKSLKFHRKFDISPERKKIFDNFIFRSW